MQKMDIKRHLNILYYRSISKCFIAIIWFIVQYAL